MNETQSPKQYDLEERTYEFARRVRAFVKKRPKTLANTEDCRQLVRCSGSIGANYIEANESLGKKDFLMRVRISRKEAKETRYWLRLVDAGVDDCTEGERKELIGESVELMKILAAILRKSQ